MTLAAHGVVSVSALEQRRIARKAPARVEADAIKVGVVGAASDKRAAAHSTRRLCTHTTMIWP
jgi:hypothetical protein